MSKIFEILSVPEKATIIDDTGTVGSGSAVADFSGGSGEAGDAVSGGEVVPALKHCIDRIWSAGWLSCGKVLSLVANLCSKVSQTCV